MPLCPLPDPCGGDIHTTRCFVYFGSRVNAGHLAAFRIPCVQYLPRLGLWSLVQYIPHLQYVITALPSAKILS